MTDLIIVLCPLSIISIYYYGARAAAVILITSAASLLTDFICIKLRRKKADKKDLSALIAGLIIALMVPASIPYHIAAIAAVFAITIGKHAFGGPGREIFSPAAVGFLFAAVNFRENMFAFPRHFESLPLKAVIYPETHASMINSFFQTSTAHVPAIDILIGKFYGGMGTTCIIILAVAAAALILRRVIPALTFIAGTAVFMLFSFIFYGYDIFSALYASAGGMFLFGFIFLCSDYKGAERAKSSSLLYGTTIGALTALFTYYGSSECAIVCASVIAAPLRVEFDLKAAVMIREIRKGVMGIPKKLSEALARAGNAGYRGSKEETSQVLTYAVSAETPAAGQTAGKASEIQTPDSEDPKPDKTGKTKKDTDSILKIRKKAPAASGAHFKSDDVAAKARKKNQKPEASHFKPKPKPEPVRPDRKELKTGKKTDIQNKEGDISNE